MHAKKIGIKTFSNDEYLVIAEKPEGLVTMGAKGEDSLYARLLESMPGSKLFAVHRLDKDTSGPVVFAKGYQTANYLNELFKKRKVYKEYVAIVYGKPKEKDFEITLPIFGIKNKSRVDLEKGSPAYTRVQYIRGNENYSMLRLILKTGRFHQIRCHLTHVGLPLVGDKIYGPKKEAKTRLMLHSEKLSFKLLSRNYNVVSKIPEEFNQIVSL